MLYLPLVNSRHSWYTLTSSTRAVNIASVSIWLQMIYCSFQRIRDVAYFFCKIPLSIRCTSSTYLMETYNGLPWSINYIIQHEWHRTEICNYYRPRLQSFFNVGARCSLATTQWCEEFWCHAWFFQKCCERSGGFRALRAPTSWM